MKYLKPLFIIITIILVGLSVWNKILLEKCKSRLQFQLAETKKMQHTAQEIEKAVVNTQTISMKFLGRTLSLVPMEKIYPDKESQAEMPANPKLILVMSEFGCNVCQDSETRFAVDLAKKAGLNYVLAIVHAGNQRYVKNYIRVNQVNFPVYFCEDDDFFTVNNLHNLPLLFLVDEENRIISAHIPLPGQPKYSEPFHEFCHYYFDQLINPD